MKILSSLFLAGILLLTACTSAPEADNTKAENAVSPASATGDSLKVDPATSIVGWIGTKQTGQHNGTFKLSNGVLTLEDGSLKGGSFSIDVASLAVNDLTGEDKNNLEGHLKSPDFFEAEKFPAARFEITSVVPYDSASATSKLEGATHIISGNLTLKDVTRNISFPAKVNIAGNAVTAQADFNIDRTQWNMNYKGPNNPADWFIKKEVNLKLDIQARTL